MAKKEQPPRLGAAGTKLWTSVTSEFEFEPHERRLLVELCHTVDTMAALQEAIDRDGVIVRKSFEETRPHPLLCELRMQRAVYTQLLKAMKLPAGVEDRAVLPARRTRFEKLRAVAAPGLA